MAELRSSGRNRGSEITRNLFFFLGGTFISRVFGFLREIFIAFSLGATHLADILYVSFRIPNFLRDIVAENAIQTAFVPSYIKWKEKGLKEKLSSNVFIIYIIFAVIISALGIIFAPFIVKITAFGFTKIPWKYNLTVKLTRILFPLIVFLFLGSFLSGILNAEKKFFPPALAPAFFNITFLILGIFFYFKYRSNEKVFLIFLGVSLLLGIFMQFFFLIPFVFKNKLFFKISPDFKKQKLKGLKPFFALLLPVVLSTSLNQIILFISTLLASLLGKGAVATLNYAFRVMHLPIAFLGVGMAVTTLPDMVKEKNKEEYLLNIYKESIIILLPAVIFMVINADGIIRILFERGAFSRVDTYQTSSVFLMYSFSVITVSLTKINLNYFYSQNKIIEPMLSFLFSTSSYLVFAPVFSKLMGVPGLALASSVASFSQWIFLLHRIPSFINRFRYKIRFLMALLVFVFLLYIKIFNIIIIELIFDGILTAIFYLGLKKLWKQRE